jgi:Ca-activated chloride channel family protein
MKRTLRLLTIPAVLAAGACASADSAKMPAQAEPYDQAPEAAEAAPAEEGAADEGDLAGAAAMAAPVRLDALPVLRRASSTDVVLARKYGVNPTVDARAQRVSRVRPGATTATVGYAARALRAGSLPDVATVRTEDLLQSMELVPPTPGTNELAVTFLPQPFRAGYDAMIVSFRVPPRGDVGLGALGAHLARPPVTVLVDVSGVESPSLATARAYVDELAQRADVVAEVRAFGLGGPARDTLESGAAPRLVDALSGAGDRLVILARGAVTRGEVDAALAVHRDALARAGVDVVGVPGGALHDDALVTLATASGGRYQSLVDAPEARARARALLTGRPEVHDLTLEVHFEPTFVERYRLVGWERSAADRGAPAPGGSLYDGEQVVLLYEVKLAQQVEVIGKVQARWEGNLAEAPLLRREPAAPSQLADARALLCAAAFAEKLRGTWWSRAYSWEDVRSALESIAFDRPRPDVALLRDLIRRAQSLDARADPHAGTPADGDTVPGEGAQ